MAAGAAKVYPKAILAIARDGALKLGSDTFNCALLTSAYTPSLDTDTHWSDVSAAEVAPGGGYAAGGSTLTGITCELSGAAVGFIAGNVQWPSSTIAAKYAVIVRRAGGALTDTDLLLAYLDLNVGGSSVSVTAGTFLVQWNAGGIFTIAPG